MKGLQRDRSAEHRDPKAIQLVNCVDLGDPVAEDGAVQVGDRGRRADGGTGRGGTGGEGSLPPPPLRAGGRAAGVVLALKGGGISTLGGKWV